MPIGSKKTKIADSKEEQVNLPVSTSDVSKELVEIKKQLTQITKQSTGTSAEFNALMDGYVNKANESQSYKAKLDHITELYEELKADFRTIKESQKSTQLELEASQKALRASEADLQHLKKESERELRSLQEQIMELESHKSELNEELDRYRELNKELEISKQDIKSEFEEYKFRAEQSLQDRDIEIKTLERNITDGKKNITDLNEKIELKLRELEYKDALLNQLIKQVSADGTVSKDAFENSRPSFDSKFEKEDDDLFAKSAELKKTFRVFGGN